MYADIESRVHSLLALALDSDTSITRGYHQPNQLKSVAVRPGAATRGTQGPQGRLSHWTVEVALKMSSGLSLPDFHNYVLEVRQTIIDTLDSYPTLDGLAGVTHSMLTSIGEPSYSTEGRVHTFEQVLYAEVKEITTIKYAE